MKQKRRERLEDMKLPFFYRWLLKLPLPDFFGWLSKHGFIAALVAYGLTLYGIWILLLLPIIIMVFTYPLIGFPFNIILGLSPLAFIIILLARVQLERAYTYWKSLQSQPMQQDVEKVVKEYVEFINTQRKKRKK